MAGMTHPVAPSKLSNRSHPPHLKHSFSSSQPNPLLAFKTLHKNQLLLEVTPPSSGHSKPSSVTMSAFWPASLSTSCWLVCSMECGFCTRVCMCVCAHAHVLTGLSLRKQGGWELPEARDLLFTLDPHPTPDPRTRVYLDNALMTSACLMNRLPAGTEVI